MKLEFEYGHGLMSASARYVSPPYSRMIRPARVSAFIRPAVFMNAAST